MHTIEINNLTKIYNAKINHKKIIALDDFSLNVNKGEVFGLLGPNGAGKTTLVKILLGIVYATSGSAELLGEDISNIKIKERIGYLPENHKFPLFLTGENVLKYYAKLSRMDMSGIDDKIDKLLSLVKMRKWKKTKVKNYSKGMMQRLGLAQALINNPEAIFLDEPTDGVDPIGRKEIRDVLAHLKEQGKTIFLNSHLLSEIELISDRVAILNKGKLVKVGTVDEITSNHEEYEITTANPLNEKIWQELNINFDIDNKIDNKFLAKVKDSEQLNKLLDEIRRNEVNISTVVPKKNSLEDMFISLINEDEGKK